MTQIQFVTIKKHRSFPICALENRLYFNRIRFSSIIFRRFTVLFSEKESVYPRVLEFPLIFALRQIDTELYNHYYVKNESD